MATSFVNWLHRLNIVELETLCKQKNNFTEIQKSMIRVRLMDLKNRIKLIEKQRIQTRKQEEIVIDDSDFEKKIEEEDLDNTEDYKDNVVKPYEEDYKSSVKKDKGTERFSDDIASLKKLDKKQSKIAPYIEQ